MNEIMNRNIFIVMAKIAINLDIDIKNNGSLMSSR